MLILVWKSAEIGKVLAIIGYSNSAQFMFLLKNALFHKFIFNKVRENNAINKFKLVNHTIQKSNGMNRAK